MVVLDYLTLKWFGYRQKNTSRMNLRPHITSSRPSIMWTSLIKQMVHGMWLMGAVIIGNAMNLILQNC